MTPRVEAKTLHMEGPGSILAIPSARTKPEMTLEHP